MTRLASTHSQAIADRPRISRNHDSKQQRRLGVWNPRQSQLPDRSQVVGIEVGVFVD